MIICPNCSTPVPTSLGPSIQCSCGTVLTIQPQPSEANPYASPVNATPIDGDSHFSAAGRIFTTEELSQLGLCRVGALLIIIGLITSLLCLGGLAWLSAGGVSMEAAKGPLAIIGLLYLAAAGLTLVGHGFFMAAPISSNSKGFFQLGFAFTIVASASPFLVEAAASDPKLSLLLRFVLAVTGISTMFIHLTGLARLSVFIQPNGGSHKFTSARTCVVIGMLSMMAIIPTVGFIGHRQTAAIVAAIFGISGLVVLIVFLVRYTAGLVGLRKEIREIIYPSNPMA